MHQQQAWSAISNNNFSKKREIMQEYGQRYVRDGGVKRP